MLFKLFFLGEWISIGASDFNMSLAQCVQRNLVINDTPAIVTKISSIVYTCELKPETMQGIKNLVRCLIVWMTTTLFCTWPGSLH